MYTLNTTVRKLEILLGGAVTTNELDVVTHYSDRRMDEKDNALAADVSVTAGATPVTIVAAPLSGVNRVVEAISVYNNDTVEATLTIRYTDDATSFILMKIDLATGEQLYYEDQAGWSVLTDEGHLRSA